MPTATPAMSPLTSQAAMEWFVPLACLALLPAFGTACASSRPMPGDVDGGQIGERGAMDAGPFDPRFDVVEEFASTCSTACEANRPRSTAVCSSTPLSFCTESCGLALRNTDRACAQCVVERMTWVGLAPGCFSADCGCGWNHASFDLSRCERTCEASVAYRKALREGARPPADVGRPPFEILEVDGRFTEIEAGPDGLFALQRHPPEIAYLSLSGKERWRHRLDDLGGALPALLSNGQQAFLHPSQNPPDYTWTAFDARGKTSALAPGLWTATSRPGVSLVGIADRVVHHYDVYGDLEGQYALPQGVRYGDGLVALQDGRYVVGSADYVYGDTTLFWLSPGDADELVIDRELPLDFEVHTVVEADGAGLFFATDSGPKGTRSNDAGAPWAGFVATAPEDSWQWRPEPRDLWTTRASILADADGALYRIATEDPESGFKEGLRHFTPSPQQPDPYADRCSVYGCGGVSVRSFDTEGELLWQFQFRSEASRVLDAALTDDQLAVLATLHREEPSTVVLLFAKN